MNKISLIEALKKVLSKQLEELKMSIDNVNESIVGEEKSTAGDKYETARAMGHNELDRLNQAYSVLMKNANVINKLNVNEKHSRVQLGSLVQTDKRVLFFSAGMGKIKLDEDEVLTMSMGSPIGQLFMSKKVGDTIEFRGTQEIILEIW